MSLQHLAANVAALMGVSTTLTSQRALAAKADIDQRTVGRMLAQQHSPNLQQIEKIAHAFGVETWHLLLPSYDPADPPAAALTKSELEAYQRARQLAAALNK